MEYNHIDHCPICDGVHFHYVHTCTDHYASGHSFALWQCDRCGLVFTQDVPSEHHIDAYYQSSAYISHTDTRQGLVNRLYHAVRQYMLYRKATWVERAVHGVKGSLLEVGSGTGYFLHTMARRGWQVTGIEKSDAARDFAAHRFGLHLLPDEALFQSDLGTFRAITLWHVLEHLELLPEVMQRFHRLLHPEGVLVIAVPNRTSFDAQHYGPQWAAYDVPRHIWHFAPEQMRLLGERFGFSLVDVRPMPFDGFYISMLSEKMSGRKASFLRGLWIGLQGFIRLPRQRTAASSLIYLFRKVPV